MLIKLAILYCFYILNSTSLQMRWQSWLFVITFQSDSYIHMSAFWSGAPIVRITLFVCGFQNAYDRHNNDEHFLVCLLKDKVGSFQVYLNTYKWKERPECLTPTVRGSSGSVMLWGAFCGHGLGPLVPLEGRVTANQYKVDLSDHLYPVILNISWTFLILMGVVSSIGQAGPPNGSMSMKMVWIIYYGLHSHQMSRHLVWKC